MDARTPHADDRHEGESVEAAARRVEAHPDYRVVRRLPDDPASEGAGEPFRWGVYVDVETTGMRAGRDAIIEVAMVLFGYDAEGRITGIEARFDGLEDPGRPIPQEVVDLTGIRDEDVAGQVLDEATVVAMVERADLVVAHNASFDRAFLEARFPAFAERPWACSAKDVPWRAEGLESMKLEYLAYRSGVFYEAHRAVTDCVAGVYVLAQPLPSDGAPAMARLLEAARRAEVLVEAFGSPYETKDLLKARGYRWRPDGKVWWRMVPADAIEAERGWLAANVYPAGARGAKETPVTAYERYSPRLFGA